jgi:hypothetical protein
LNSILTEPAPAQCLDAGDSLLERQRRHVVAVDRGRFLEAIGDPDDPLDHASVSRDPTMLRKIGILPAGGRGRNHRTRGRVNATALTNRGIGDALAHHRLIHK